MSSYCLGASYEHAHACSTQSPKTILPLPYFILQPERGYNSLRIGTKETHDILSGCRLYWNSTVKEKICGTQSVLSRQKLATCYSVDKNCQRTFTSFFLTQVSYGVLDKENLANHTFLRISFFEYQTFSTSDNFGSQPKCICNSHCLLVIIVQW